MENGKVKCLIAFYGIYGYGITVNRDEGDL